MRIALVILFILFAASPAAAQSVSDVREAIQKQQGKADKSQGKIQSLEGKEKKLKKQLVAIETEVKNLQQEISLQEESLVDIEAQEAIARADYRKLQAWRKTLEIELHELISTLWPIHNQRVTGRLKGLDNWQETDRRFTWLAAVYSATSDRLGEAIRTSNLMAANLEEQSRLAREAENQLAQININKDSLLRKRLSLHSSLRKTESSITNLEKELGSILTVIKGLNYKLKTQRTKRFADNKKLLPWPATGSIASTFSPWATPARRGIGLQTKNEAEVKSVFWGKVVHADTVRGFGRVVIVYHGHDYYSVYAYLSRALVEPGQEVEKDEPIGAAGFDPRTKKPGMYFELRSGSKPINPVKWLFPK